MRRVKLAEIDPDNPGELYAAVAKQSALFGDVVWRMHRQERRVSRLELALEHREAVALAKYKEQRVAVSLVKKLVSGDAKVLKIKARLRDAVSLYNYYKNMISVFTDRGRQLTNLSILASKEQKNADF